MANRHLITKQTFELKVGFDEGNIPRLQESFSRQFWQSVVPAFDRLFDQLVGPHELVRVDRLELDVGRWSAEDILSGRFVESLVLRLESEISSAMQGAGVETEVQSVRTGYFFLWLHFLEHGFLPVGAIQPETQEEWHRQVIESLAADSGAAQRLRNLVSRQSVALERLILQHDEVFLQRLLECLTNCKQDNLLKLVGDVVSVIVRAVTDLSDRIGALGGEKPTELESIADVLLELLTDLLEPLPDGGGKSELRSRVVRALGREASSPASLAQWLIQADSWRMVLNGFAQAEVIHGLSNRIVEVLRESTSLRNLAAKPSPGRALSTRELKRRIVLAVWRILVQEVIVKMHQGDTFTLIAKVIRSDALLPWRGMLLRTPGAGGVKQRQEDAWSRLAEALKELSPQAQKGYAGNDKTIELDAKREALSPDAAEDVRISGVEESNLFYVQSAGVILFHPFLYRFFRKLNLCDEGAFIDEASRQRAVCLVHHLATGEVHTPEYQLVLPKFLCGMPLNAPLDHFIEIRAAERSESENLIYAAIEHWGALGSCSPDWLREMFLQRDGKLEKRETGWRFSVEHKAQDILLDRLPHGWGFGIVKLPWMSELLRVDWR